VGLDGTFGASGAGVGGALGENKYDGFEGKIGLDG
jgi:hypothetical protein